MIQTDNPYDPPKSSWNPEKNSKKIGIEYFSIKGLFYYTMNLIAIPIMFIIAFYMVYIAFIPSLLILNMVGIENIENKWFLGIFLLNMCLFIYFIYFLNKLIDKIFESRSKFIDNIEIILVLISALIGLAVSISFIVSIYIIAEIIPDDGIIYGSIIGTFIVGYVTYSILGWTIEKFIPKEIGSKQKTLILFSVFSFLQNKLNL